MYIYLYIFGLDWLNVNYETRIRELIYLKQSKKYAFIFLVENLICR